MAFLFNLSPDRVNVPRRGWSSIDDLAGRYQANKKEAATNAAVDQFAGGLDPEMAAQVAPLLRNAATREQGLQIIRDRMKPNDLPNAVQEFQYAQSNPQFEQYQLRQKAAAAPRAPSGFAFTGDGGLEPIPGGPADPDYLRSKPDRANAPPGYSWVDPTNPEAGLVAIPGGPGEKITPETAARIGLSDSFVKDLDDEIGSDGSVIRKGIRSEVKAGSATGLVDYAAGAQGIGPQGRVHARIKSGSEALLRNLTGAGMNMTEAQEYAKRYEPTVYDTADTLAEKLDQLQRELSSVNEVVGRGRGGARATSAPPAVKAGASVDGYIFRGGDPSDQKNWIKDPRAK